MLIFSRQRTSLSRRLCEGGYTCNFHCLYKQKNRLCSRVSPGVGGWGGGTRAIMDYTIFYGKYTKGVPFLSKMVYIDGIELA